MQDRRIFQRIKVNFPVKFSYADGIKEGTGRMIDISAGGGGMIVTTEELHPAMHLEMWLIIPDNKEPLHTSGGVIWSNKIESNLYKAGVQFDKVDFMGISRALRSRHLL